jgi:hypothetical protein
MGSPAAPSRGPLSVHIDRVVIDGPRLTPAQTAVFLREVEVELSRLWESHPGNPIDRGGATPALTAPAISLSRSASPARLGRQVARSLFDLLGGKDR